MMERRRPAGSFAVPAARRGRCQRLVVPPKQMVDETSRQPKLQRMQAKELALTIW